MSHNFYLTVNNEDLNQKMLDSDKKFKFLSHTREIILLIICIIV